MTKRSFNISPLDAFRIAALLKTAKPRRATLRESLAPLHDSVMAAFAEADDKHTIEDAVTEAITETVNFPPPVSDAQSLDNMGYTDPTYAKLAAKLTDIVRHYKPSETILRSVVKAAGTVGACVDLVIGKAGV